MSPTAAPIDTDAVESNSRPGRFEEDARRAAIAGAIKLLGTYFSGGEASNLANQPALSRSTLDDSVRPLVTALRLRVALAAAARLVGIAERISKRPNFRYTVNRSESVGQVRGKLDLTRLVRSNQVVTGPPRWPIIDSHRIQVTPENVLLAGALLWTIRELGDAHRNLIGLPVSGPESRETHLMLARLRRSMSTPLLASCRDEGTRVLRQGRLGDLVGTVSRRLRAGHVARSGVYTELVQWVSDCLAGTPAASAGEIDWSFYGPEFDEKLFEIWCLKQLGDVLSAIFYQVNDPNLLIGSNIPCYRWSTPVGSVEIYFQRSISTIDDTQIGKWLNDESGDVLRGIPDLVVHVQPTGGEQKFVLVDPKLRKRKSAPSEEIYKILGYFDNFGMETSGLGAILFYAPSPDERASYRFSTVDGGRVVAAPLDPKREAYTARNLQNVAELIVGALGLAVSTEDLRVVASRSEVVDEDLDEAVVDSAQKMGLAYLRTFRDSKSAVEQGPWTNVARSFLEDSWDDLSEDLQTMIATAVWVGFSLEDGSDFSGPVLGLSAAAESIIWDYVIEPALSHSRTLTNYKMFGQMLGLLSEALGSPTTREARRVRAFIDAQGFGDLLSGLVNNLTDMNRTLRRPAAHRDVLRREAWNVCRQQMLASDDPLLPGLAAALIRPSGGPGQSAVRLEPIDNR